MHSTRRSILGAAAAVMAMASVLAAQPKTEFDKFFSTALGEKDAVYMFLGYSAVLVRTPAGTVIIDPAGLLADEDIAALAGHKVDALLYTHGHGDHFNAAAAKAIFQATGATIVAEPGVADSLRKAGGIPAAKILVPPAGETVKAGAALVRGVPGRHVGSITLFQVRLGPLSVFHGGDSAYVPLADYPAKIAFLPTGRPSPTASPDDALKMALDVKPEAVILMHGSDEQNAAFVKLAKAKLPGVAVEVPATFKATVVHLR